MGIYVYGVMRANEALGGLKVEEGALRARPVEHDGLAALVSDFDESEARVRRESLFAHTDVLRSALRAGPVAPLRFGTVMPDETTLIETLLEPRGPELRSRLDALEGKAEIQVKANFLEEPLLRSVMAADPVLAHLAQRVRSLPADASHFERIRLGELIAAAVQARREATTESLIGALRPLALAVSLGEPRHERAALTAAFLLEQDRLAEFDAAVEELSRQHADELEFTLIGPLAAHSFIESGWEGAPTWA